MPTSTPCAARPRGEPGHEGTHVSRVLRIEDLRVPQLTAGQQSVVDYGRTLEVSLAEREVVAEARSMTGLDDFGSDDVWPRVRAHLAAIEGDAGLNNFARLTLRRRVVQLLASRLRLT